MKEKVSKKNFNSLTDLSNFFTLPPDYGQIANRLNWSKK